MAKKESELGKRLKLIRQHIGCTQSEAAKTCGGFALDVWSRLERGDAEGISLVLLEGLAAFAQCHEISLEWLFTGEGGLEALPETSNEFSRHWILTARLPEILKEHSRVGLRMGLINKMLEDPECKGPDAVANRHKMAVDFKEREDEYLGRHW